jgi:hypothetical protein
MALEYLMKRGCDIGFLSVDTSRDHHHLYERLGFRMLPKPFIYANIHGELKESDGGMVVPLYTPEICETILKGDSKLNLTPELGYW